MLQVSTETPPSVPVETPKYSYTNITTPSTRVSSTIRNSAAAQASTREIKPNKHHTNIRNIQNSNYKSSRVVSPYELVDRMEVLLHLLELCQHVVDAGVAPDTDTCSQLLHELVHRFVLATCRRTRNA